MQTMPLSNREYYALRELFGIVNSFTRNADFLKHRLEMIPNGTEDMSNIATAAENLMFEILKTIPTKKLFAIRQELENTVCEVKVLYNFAKTDDREFVYIPAVSVDRLVTRVMNSECLICDKNAKQAKKCPIFEDISACYPWNIPPKGDACPLAGYFITED
jgi:hypothetical protein